MWALACSGTAPLLGEEVIVGACRSRRLAAFPKRRVVQAKLDVCPAVCATLSTKPPLKVVGVSYVPTGGTLSCVTPKNRGTKPCELFIAGGNLRRKTRNAQGSSNQSTC